MRRYFKYILGITIVLFSMLFIAPSTSVEAAEAPFQSLDMQQLPEGASKKIGNYYFFRNNFSIYFSKTRSGKRTRITEAYENLVTDGKTGYYLTDGNDKGNIYKYTLSSKKRSKIAALPHIGSVAGKYGNKLILGGHKSKGVHEPTICETYVYNLSSKKLKIIASEKDANGSPWGVAPASSYGRYSVLMGVELVADAPAVMYVYDIKTDKRILLAKQAMQRCEFSKTKLLYAKVLEKNKYTSKVKFYSYNCAAAKSTPLTSKTVNASWITKITDKYAKYYVFKQNGGKEYTIRF